MMYIDKIHGAQLKLQMKELWFVLMHAILERQYIQFPIMMMNFQMRFFSNDVHLERKLCSIVFNDDGIVICIFYRLKSMMREFQMRFALMMNIHWKYNSPMIVIDNEIEICFNDDHRQKTLFWIVVTDDGITISFNDEHPQKKNWYFI